MKTILDNTYEIAMIFRNQRFVSLEVEGRYFSVPEDLDFTGYYRHEVKTLSDRELFVMRKKIQHPKFLGYYPWVTTYKNSPAGVPLTCCLIRPYLSRRNS